MENKPEIKFEVTNLPVFDVDMQSKALSEKWFDFVQSGEKVQKAYDARLVKLEKLVEQADQYKEQIDLGVKKAALQANSAILVIKEKADAELAELKTIYLKEKELIDLKSQLAADEKIALAKSLEIATKEHAQKLEELTLKLENEAKIALIKLNNARETGERDAIDKWATKNSMSFIDTATYKEFYNDLVARNTQIEELTKALADVQQKEKGAWSQVTNAKKEATEATAHVKALEEKNSYLHEALKRAESEKIDFANKFIEHASAKATRTQN